MKCHCCLQVHSTHDFEGCVASARETRSLIRLMVAGQRRGAPNPWAAHPCTWLSQDAELGI